MLIDVDRCLNVYYLLLAAWCLMLVDICLDVLVFFFWLLASVSTSCTVKAMHIEQQGPLRLLKKKDYRVVAGFDAAEEFANGFHGYRTFTILVGVVLNCLELF